MTTNAQKSAARLEMISPQFVVPDAAAAAEYYRNVFGFRILGNFGEPPVYSIVRRDVVEIHPGRANSGAAARNAPHREDSLDAYVWVDGVDGLFDEFRSRGANIVEPPTVRVYKCYEMVVEDKLGFRLAFAKDISERG
jgi:uncharacterized glyoxalase superfamily protein PhnB